MDTKTFTTLTFSEAEPGVGLVTLNRPERLNAINPAMVQDFETLFAALAQDETIRVLILTGAGRGFCSGGRPERCDGLPSDGGLRRSGMLSPARSGALRPAGPRSPGNPQPVIAAVNGPAAGAGFCLALASDVRFASPGPISSPRSSTSASPPGSWEAPISFPASSASPGRRKSFTRAGRCPPRRRSGWAW